MARLSIEYPATRCHAAFAKAFADDRQEGETDAQLLKRQVQNFIKEVTKSVEANEAAENARKSALDAAESELDIK